MTTSPVRSFLSSLKSDMKSGKATEHTYRPALKTLFETVLVLSQRWFDGQVAIGYAPWYRRKRGRKNMPSKLYHVKLSDAEREHLENLVSSGVEKARKLRRARILMKADEEWTDRQISDALDVSRPTVERTRQRYVQEGFMIALNGQAGQRRYERKLDGRDEAHLIALVCGPPPEGYAQWSLRLLADEFVRLEQVDIESISHETVRQVLKKMNLSPGNASNG